MLRERERESERERERERERGRDRQTEKQRQRQRQRQRLRQRELFCCCHLEFGIAADFKICRNIHRNMKNMLRKTCNMKVYCYDNF